ncbi:MAG: flavodoxin-dependent (E)-4-hydroxy-3-methylbut-2-enyl-diphosphate synthase [Phycisphaerae bacterium]
MRYPTLQHRTTRPVQVGSVIIGGGSEVVVQSMTNTRTADVDATLDQIRRLARAGAELVRVAVPTAEETAALKQIIPASPVPLVADVHFHFDRALEAIAAGIAKIRLNPGNIRDRDQVRRVIDAAGAAGCAIRIGVNEGSVPVEAADSDKPLDELMVEKLAEYLQPFEEARFEKLVLSAKSHDAVTCVSVNRRIARQWDWPLHLGVTHAGTAETGSIRSAAALGALLCEGIGETIRISYAGDPVAEVGAAVELLASLRLRKRTGLELIACPSCGRLQMDLDPIIRQVQQQLSDLPAPVSVAIMGCVVNGPGEAEGADVAICAGKGKGVLYRFGEKVGTVQAAQMAGSVCRLAREIADQRART